MILPQKWCWQPLLCLPFLNFLLFLPRCIIKYLSPTNGEQVFYLLPVFTAFHCLISLLFLCFLFRRQNERKAYRDNKKQLQVLFTAVVFCSFYFFYFFFGTVFMMERMATSVMSTLKRSATMAAKRTSVLSVRPTKIFCRGTKPLPFSPVKIAVERATPKAAPKEEAIL